MFCISEEGKHKKETPLFFAGLLSTSKTAVADCLQSSHPTAKETHIGVNQQPQFGVNQQPHPMTKQAISCHQGCCHVDIKYSAFPKQSAPSFRVCTVVMDVQMVEVTPCFPYRVRAVYRIRRSQ